ncbi:MAG: signal recognition particle protein, partial [Lentisphaerae bacterium]
MFESLSDRLNETFRNLTGRGALSERNIEEAMNEIRIALLEADVNYQVVKDFIAEVREECLGEKVLRGINPGQMTIKIVYDHMVKLMGEAAAPLQLTPTPAFIMMVGLHGSGKTTTSAKLALHLKQNEKKKVMLVAADLMRPAAIDQLETLANQVGVEFYADRNARSPIQVAMNVNEIARSEKFDVVIFDTAGRLQIDESLVRELVDVRNVIQPNEILLVADAALGQEAVSVATHFNDALDISGIVLTKLDGDARGGAALSMRKVTGKPIKLVGVGEKMEDLQMFHPDRMADRILGMGDVVSLVESIQQKVDEDEAAELGEV